MYSTGGNAGKSSFVDRLTATYRSGVFRASSRSNQQGVGYRYAEEGLIIFDLARKACFAIGLMELIELVTNTGATLPMVCQRFTSTGALWFKMFFWDS